MSQTAQANGITYGVAMIVAAAFTISLQDTVFKLFSSNLTLWQVFSLRGLIAVLLLVLLGVMRHQIREVGRQAFQLWPLLRALCLTATFLAFYAALPFISLSTAGAAIYIAPVFVAVLCANVIGERVGVCGWIGVLVGFCGVIALLQPGTDAFSPFALLPIAGAGFYAVAHVITRVRCQDVPVAALALALNVSMCAAGILISLLLTQVDVAPAALAEYGYLLGPWALLQGSDWLVLTLLAVLAVSVGMMRAAAYQAAPPTIIATFEYSYLVFAAVWDILLFDQAPNGVSYLGMVLIVLAGLLVMRRGA